MPHPLVLQLRFTRSEFHRALKAVTAEEGVRRFEPLNSISWLVGHLAWQEQLYWLTQAQGLNPAPEVNACANGQPPCTPPLDEMWAAWRSVTQASDAWLDTLDSATLATHTLARRAPHDPYKESIGTRLRRTTYLPLLVPHRRVAGRAAAARAHRVAAVRGRHRRQGAVCGRGVE